MRRTAHTLTSHLLSNSPSRAARAALVAAGLALLASTPRAGDPPLPEPQPVMLEGHRVPGMGRVEHFFRVSWLDDGSVLALVRTSGGHDLWLRDGELLVEQGATSPLLEAGESAWYRTGAARLPASGPLGFTGAVGLSSDASGAETSSGVLARGALLAREGQRALAADLPDGTTYGSSFAFAWANGPDSDEMLALVDLALPGEVNERTALLRWEINAQGVRTETLVAREGAPLPGTRLLIADLAPSSEAVAFNAAGQVLYNAEPASPAGASIYLDDQVLATQGAPAANSGGTWGDIGGANVALNDAGTWALRCSLQGGSSVSVLVRDGELLAMGGFGSVPPGVVPENPNPFGVALDDAGRVAWSSKLFMLDPFVNADGLWVDQQLLVREGLSSALGQTLVSLRGTPLLVAPSFDLEPSGDRLLFTGQLEDGTVGVFVVPASP